MVQIEPIINLSFSDMMGVYRIFEMMWTYFEGGMDNLGYIPTIIRLSLIEKVSPLTVIAVDNDSDLLDSVKVGFTISIGDSNFDISGKQPSKHTIYFYICDDDKFRGFKSYTMSPIFKDETSNTFIFIPEKLFKLSKIEATEELTEEIVDIILNIFSNVFDPYINNDTFNTIISFIFAALFSKVNLNNIEIFKYMDNDIKRYIDPELEKDIYDIVDIICPHTTGLLGKLTSSQLNTMRFTIIDAVTIFDRNIKNQSI